MSNLEIGLMSTVYVEIGDSGKLPGSPREEVRTSGGERPVTGNYHSPFPGLAKCGSLETDQEESLWTLMSAGHGPGVAGRLLSSVPKACVVLCLGPHSPHSQLPRCSWTLLPHPPHQAVAWWPVDLAGSLSSHSYSTITYLLQWFIFLTAFRGTVFQGRDPILGTIWYKGVVQSVFLNKYTGLRKGFQDFSYLCATFWFLVYSKNTL